MMFNLITKNDIHQVKYKFFIRIDVAFYRTPRVRRTTQEIASESRFMNRHYVSYCNFFSAHLCAQTIHFASLISQH